MLKNKKGFSLIELLVAIAILVLIVAVLVPQYRQSSIKAKENADSASVENLIAITKTAILDKGYVPAESENEGDKSINIYQLCKDAVEKSESKNMVVEFYVANGTIYPHALNCTIDNKNNAEVRQYLIDIIGSQLKSIPLESDLYKTYKYTITFTFPDIDMKVNVEHTTSEYTFVSGDVNRDGKVDTSDRAMLIDYVQLNQNVHTMNLAAADVNVDGKINDTDTMIIREHIASNTTYATLPYIKATN